MAISGLIGGGATDALDEIVIQALAKKKFAEQLRARQVEEQQRAQQMRQQQGQFNARLGFDQSRAAADDKFRAADDARADAEVQQAGINDLRDQQERQRVNFTRINNEQEINDAIAGTTDPRVRQILGLRRAGVNVNPNDLRTDEERRAEETFKTNEEIRRDYARQAAEKKFSERTGTASGTPVTDAYTDERHGRTRAAAEALLQKVGNWTTGAGSLLAGVPGSDARNFDAELNTLKSNIAFNELAQMRAASKTGGALGAVSDKEMRLLESALGALDTGQSPGQFKAQLQKVVDSLDRFESARALSRTPGNEASVTMLRYERGPDGKLRRVP